MSARRKKRKYNPIRKSKRRLFLYILSVALFLFTIITFKSRNYWDRDAKLSLLIPGVEGNINVVTFDPVSEEIINIRIPSNTQVEVAQRFGIFKLGNVWKLGFSEGLEGDLLAKTVTKGFKFPVYAWADNEAYGFASTNYIDVLKATILRYETNLKVGDRLYIALFSIGIPNSKRIEIDLADTPYLKKTKLIDGEEGYVVVKNMPTSLLSVFADPVITKEEYKAVIVNNTRNPLVAKQVGEVIEVLGAKIASVKTVEDDVDGCVVKGTNKATIETVSRIFGCRIDTQGQKTSLDIEIILGNNFQESF